MDKVAVGEFGGMESCKATHTELIMLVTTYKASIAQVTTSETPNSSTGIAELELMRKTEIRGLLAVWEEFGHRDGVVEGGKKVSPEIEEMGGGGGGAGNHVKNKGG